ncbi:MAG TPA: putative ABC exporter domain-containing protein, partial [Gemmatimonadaceae bacterium]|nr:putative ABC exporter domain-containing protein [Gemmatimonadaceae bacterium]
MSVVGQRAADDATPPPPAPSVERGTGGAGGPPTGNVVDAFVYLTTRSFVNRARLQLQRARNPRYALALALGAAYFYFALFRQARPINAASLLFGTGADIVLALGVVALATRWWIFGGGDQTALAFTPAEVQFLFPAPVTRRGLVHFKLLRSQLVVLVNTLVWMALLRRGNASLPIVLRALSFWVLFSTLALHRLGATLVRSTATEHGVAGARRSVVPVVVVGAVVAIVVGTLVRALPALRAALPEGDFFAVLKHALTAPVPAAALYPFRAVLRPGLAATVSEWSRTFWPAALIAVAHYAWVVRSNAAFEEAAVEASARRAARIAALRQGRGWAAAAAAGAPGNRPVARSWFPLHPTGEPAVAILWKNVLAVTRTLRWATLAVLVASVGILVVVVSLQASGPRAGTLLGTIAGVWGALTVFTGPLWIRNDLRQDLPKLALLRSYPLRGSRVVAAQVASSTIVLTAIQYVLMVVAYLALMEADDAPLTAGGRTFALL